jgi:dienelactone hydrolase
MDKRVATSLCLLGSLVGCSGSDPAYLSASLSDSSGAATVQHSGKTVESPIVNLPKPTGSFAVGRTSFDWIDETRDEIFTSQQTDKRELMAYVWYPASDDVQQSAPWLDPSLASAVSKVFSVDAKVLDSVKCYSYLGAKLSGQLARYPVLLMSHGDGGAPLFYSSVAEELASHGYVVVGISHSYNALVTVFGDGRVAHQTDEALALGAGQKAPERYEQWNELWDRSAKIVGVFADDELSVIRHLKLLNAEDSQFKGRLDLSTVGSFGHSLGGATSVEVLRRGMVSAAVDIDGTVFSDVYQHGLSKPVMVIAPPVVDLEEPSVAKLKKIGWTAEQFSELRDRTLSHRLVYERSPRAYWVGIKGAEHLNFTDNGLLAQIFPSLGEDLGEIDVSKALFLSRTYLVAFFDKSLKGQDSPILASKSAYSEVEFESKR